MAVSTPGSPGRMSPACTAARMGTCAVQAFAAAPRLGMEVPGTDPLPPVRMLVVLGLGCWLLTMSCELPTINASSFIASSLHRIFFSLLQFFSSIYPTS